MAKTQVTTPAKNAPVAAAPAAAPEKALTKMQRAEPIFKAVMAMTPEQLGGKTHRRVFMDRAIAELDMKQAGANTYFQNLKNEADGEGRYKYSPASTAPAAPVAESGDPVLDAINKLGTRVTELNRTVKRLDKAIAAGAHA